MANIEDIYRQLTNVDINQQKLLWDERGKGYWGEFLVFQQLYPLFPGSNCKILMNIQVPATQGKTTEIDLLLIHETGIYVFEIKHYKGTIYGKTNDLNWTQYFRTAPNQHFHNPILQNQHHINALRQLFPNVPMHSVIVFTNDECTPQITCNEPFITICTLASLYYRLGTLCSGPILFSSEQLDSIFRTLLPYSPTMQSVVTIDEKELPFHEYISSLSSDYAARAQQLEAHYTNKSQQIEADCNRQKKRFKLGAIGAGVAAITTTLVAIGLCIAVCVIYKQSTDTQVAEAYRQMDAEVNAAHKELDTFKKKFEHVKPYNDGNIRMETNFIESFDVELKNSIDVRNAVNLQFSLQWNGEYYGAKITRNTKIIVILKDGSVKEYDLRESVFPGKNSDIYLGVGNVFYSAHSTVTFPIHELADVSMDDISYIKLSGLDIWVQEDGSFSFKDIGTGYEVLIVNFPF